ncbi:hypothetical protein PHMEG_00010003 [Phytophthora megakarya]|uniref:RNase H type-1 domain-containing protein n=1 Tax=Phytophthora megakarya TaxID=4795 RepID=A0A225WFD1_9STRA|nr:hypothetical protein PHMEG_00010003 [Phytophthora megakarya]
MFFDGGSRGNPGPDTVAEEPIWMASMSYASKATTNNQAEYQGLLSGLLYARKKQLQPLHVVGDSQMIIRQQQKRLPPKINVGFTREPIISELSTKLRTLLQIWRWIQSTVAK